VTIVPSIYSSMYDQKCVLSKRWKVWCMDCPSEQREVVWIPSFSQHCQLPIIQIPPGPQYNCIEIQYTVRQSVTSQEYRTSSNKDKENFKHLAKWNKKIWQVGRYCFKSEFCFISIYFVQPASYLIYSDN
jgi:hypothetical protein